MDAESREPARAGRRPVPDGGRAGRRSVASFGAGALAALACGLLGIGLLAAGTRAVTPGALEGPVGGEGGWTRRTPAWIVADGFYPPEVDAARGHGFSWSGRRARLLFPNLDRSQAYRLTLHTSMWRPSNGPEPPQLQLSVDGGLLPPVQTANEQREIVADIPRRAEGGTAIAFELSNTFVPGPHDSRDLGIIIEDVTLAPSSGHFSASRRVLGQLGLAVMASVAGLLLCGLRSRLAAAAAAAVVLGFVGLVLRDGAFVGTYADRLVPIGIGIALAGAALGVVRSRWPAVAGLPDWSVAAGLVLAAGAIQLALFWHPQAIVGDGIFQVHRAALVHSGTYVFTSITPKPFFEFPYPVGLYVAAQPFWSYFPSELDLVRLLRGLTLGAAALAGLVIYAAARRQWNDAYTALLGTALWMLAKAPLQALSNANLTNAFGQALFGTGLGLLVWSGAGTRASPAALVAAGGVLSAAFLSHFGTALTGVPILCAVAAALLAFGRGHVRRFGAWVLVVVVATSAFSYGVYYSRFNAVYRTTLARMAEREAGTPVNSKVVAPPAVKFQRWSDGTSDDYGLPGLPLLAAAGVGLFLLVKRRPREAFTLALVGWALAWIAFTALEIFSPLELRANLATAPVFVCLGAYALGSLNAHSRAGALLAGAVALLVGWEGVRICLLCVGLNPTL
jgi:hypothetical protein